MRLKHDAFVVFHIKQAMSMCLCLHSRLASCLASLTSSPPYVAAGWHAGRVNKKKKGAKDRQDKQFRSTNLRMYQVYHFLGGSSCMVKNEGKGRKMTGFQRHRKIVVLMDIIKASQTSMAD